MKKKYDGIIKSIGFAYLGGGLLLGSVAMFSLDPNFNFTISEALIFSVVCVLAAVIMFLISGGGKE